MGGDGVCLSVVLPVFNAMPYLPLSVLHMLHQDLGGQKIEVVCADDGSKDGSFEFLMDLASLMGPSAEVLLIDPPTSHESDSVSHMNPALVKALRAEETEDHPSFSDSVIPEQVKTLSENPLTPNDVLLHSRGEHILRVLTYKDRRNRGQGATMSLCLRHCKADLVAQMESDDERPRTDAFAIMIDSLRKNPDWDGVSCRTKCIGWERPGMQRYVDWQNQLLAPEDMQKERFVEIPALHQTAIFKRSTIIEVTGGWYRDGPRGDCRLDLPVDMGFWLEFFHRGFRCGKVPEELLGWRQHPRQHTRTHGRLSIPSLRQIKVDFLLRPGGPAHRRHVQVWSVGETLAEWAADLAAHASPPLSVTQVAWRPSQPPPAVDPAAAGERAARLFAFGHDKARRRVRAALRNWDDRHDWFVA